MRNEYKILVINLKGRDHSEDLGIWKDNIKNGFCGNRTGMCGLDSSGSGYDR
jgi:hypothetical protein